MHLELLVHLLLLLVLAEKVLVNLWLLVHLLPLQHLLVKLLVNLLPLLVP